ncbi:MAG: GntR family transcriptional regulator [Xanthomonadales bacterium]|nr:GntR family transcriptional regulator [Xanthomonadales bacterium]
MDSALFLSASDPRPMYQQIVDQISARVLAGDWLPGQALPSIRELAAASQVSVITVKRAYEELERAGLILTRQGKGSVVADQPEPARQRLEASLLGHLQAAISDAERLGLDSEQLQQRLTDALDAHPRLRPHTGAPS